MSDTIQCCGTGALSKLAVGKTGGTITRMDFIEFRPNILKTFSDGSTKSIRGTLDHEQANVGEGLLHVGFRTSFWLSAQKLALLLPSLGFTASGQVFTLGDVIPDSTVIIAPGGGKEHTFVGCIPSDWVLYGQKGGDPVAIDIGWVGKAWSEAVAGTFFTSQTSPAMVEGPTFPFGDGANNVNTLSVLGQTLAFPQFRLSVDNKLAIEFNNSVTATNICPTDHVINFATSGLYSTCDGTTALFTTPAGGSVAGASLTLTLSRTVATDTYGVTVVGANAKLLARFPTIKKNDFNRLPINAQIYADGTTPALVITVDNT